MIQIIFAGKQSLHDLSDYHQGRVAGIVVYIFQTHIHGILVVIRQHFQLVTGGIKCRLHDVEVDR